MKKIFIIVLALVTTVIVAQKKEKIKGNREVLIKKFLIPSFKKIEIGEKFEIELMKATDTTRVVIETDDNLFDVIQFSVDDDILHFYTTMDIVKKKRLRITVYVSDKFKKISLTERAKVYNKEQFSLKNLQLKAIQKSKVNLNLNIEEILEIEAADKSELQLEALTTDTYLHLTGNAILKSKLITRHVEVNLDDHSNCELQGNVEYMKADVQLKSEFKSVDFQTKDAVLTVKDKAKASINNLGNLELKLFGETQTYIYGNPKITLTTFKDHAVLYKK